MAKLSLVVPVYNEEKYLEQIVENILKIENDDYAIKNNISLEIILVDDCSSDDSLKIAKNLEIKSDKIKVFSNTKNLGKGASLRCGFEVATGDFIGIQDADFEYDPMEYIKLLKPMIENDADVVYGSRYLKKDIRRVQKFWHTLINKTLTMFSNMINDLNLTDMETCYKLFKKNVIKKIAPKLKENRFGFEPEITAHIAKGGYKIYECAIKYNPRTYEEGKKIKAKDGFRALYCILHYGASSAPMPIQFLLYVIIGGICTIVNIALFLILESIYHNIFLNVGIAFIISALLNYFLCIFFLFKHKARWSSQVEVLTYIFALIVMLGLDYFITNSLIQLKISPFWSKTLANFVGLFGNFLLRKFLVFYEKK